MKTLKKVAFDQPRLGMETAEEEQLIHEALNDQIKTKADTVSRDLMLLRLQDAVADDDARIRQLAQERLLFRRLSWRTDYRDLGEEETPGYGILHLRVGARRGRLSFTVGVDNIFDRLYIEHLSYLRDPFRSGARVPEPGRNFFAHVSCRF